MNGNHEYTYDIHTMISTQVCTYLIRLRHAADGGVFPEVPELKGIEDLNA